MIKFIFSALLSFVLTQSPQCKVYETYDPDTQKCEKVCKKNEYFLMKIHLHVKYAMKDKFIIQNLNNVKKKKIHKNQKQNHKKKNKKNHK